MKYLVKAAKFNAALKKFQRVSVVRDTYSQACETNFRLKELGWAVKMSVKLDLEDHDVLPNRRPVPTK